MFKLQNFSIATLKSLVNLARLCSKNGKDMKIQRLIKLHRNSRKKDHQSIVEPNVAEKYDDTEHAEKRKKNLESKFDAVPQHAVRKVRTMLKSAIPTDGQCARIPDIVAKFDAKSGSPNRTEVTAKNVDKFRSGNDGKSGGDMSQTTGDSGKAGKSTGKSKSCASLFASKICGCGDDNGVGENGDGDQQKETEYEKRKVTIIPGDGVGPEVCAAMQQVLEAAGAPIEWDQYEGHIIRCDDGKSKLPEDLLCSLETNKIGIKGPMPMSRNSLGALLAKEFGLYAFVAHCKSIEGLETPYDPIDVVIIRDQTEGEYSGIEHEVAPGIVQSIKVGTAGASTRLAKYVFEYASKNERKKITVAHKANIMRLTDGIFLNSVRKVAEKYLDKLQFEERYLDTVCLRLIRIADLNDIIVSSSMYGDVLTVMCASMIGGLPVCPCYHVSPKGILYDCAHRMANSIAGKDLVNPTSIIRSAEIMLRDMGFEEHAMKIHTALSTAYKEGVRTMDVGGKSKCSEFTQALCEIIKDGNRDSC